MEQSSIIIFKVPNINNDLGRMVAQKIMKWDNRFNLFKINVNDTISACPYEDVTEVEAKKIQSKINRFIKKITNGTTIQH